MDFVKKITINYKILLFVKEFMKSNEWRDKLEFSSKGFFFFLLTRKKTIPPPPQAFVNDFAKCFFFLISVLRSEKGGSLLKKEILKHTGISS